MEQLMMRWRNDGKKTDVIDIPKDVEIKNWVEIDNPLDNWLDIIQHGLTKNKKDEEFYKQCNYRYEYYKPEDLIGKNVLFIANFPPRKMMGLESNGMILSAEHDGKLVVTTTLSDIQSGAQIV